MTQKSDLPTFSQLPYGGDRRQEGFQHYVVDGSTGELIKGGQRIATTYTISPRIEQNVSYQTGSVLPRIRMDPGSLKDQQKFVSSFDTVGRGNYLIEEGRGIGGGTSSIVGGTSAIVGGTSGMGGGTSGVVGQGSGINEAGAVGTNIGGTNPRTVIYSSSGVGGAQIVGPSGFASNVGTNNNNFGSGVGPSNVYTGGVVPSGGSNAYGNNTYGTSGIVSGGGVPIGSSGIVSGGGVPIGSSNLPKVGEPSATGVIPTTSYYYTSNIKPAPYSAVVPTGGNVSSVSGTKAALTSLIEPDSNRGAVPPDYKLRRDDESPQKHVIWGKVSEEDKEQAAQSRRIETFAAKNQHASSSLFKNDEVSDKDSKCKVCSCANCPSCQSCIGSCKKCQCGAIPKWLIYLLLGLILLTLFILGGYFIYKLIPHSLLPAGYECPQPYFQNGTHCLKCINESSWNGTVCIKSDGTTVTAQSTEPVKIDPTIAKYKVTKTNVTSKDQCASDQIFQDNSCLKCPSGSSWNGTHCYVPPPPGPQSKTALAEAVCKVGQFLKNGKCLKCPAGTVWNGDHCVKKVVLTSTQDQLLSPIEAHNTLRHMLTKS